MASAAVKAEGAELFKGGIMQQKLGASAAAKFATSGEEAEGVRALAQYLQSAEFFARALGSGAYEGAVRNTLATKQSDVGAKLEELKGKLSAGAAQQADGEAAKALAAWQAKRGGAAATAAVAAPAPSAAAAAAAAPAARDRDAFKLAIGVLKEAAKTKALLKGD
jgi:hypothetical protein